MFQDLEGILWFCTRAGVSSYDGRAFSTLKTGGTRSFLLDREGHLWIGRMAGGVDRYNGKVFRYFTTDDGLPSSNTRPRLQDKNGDLWFSGSEGLLRYDGRTFAIFTTEDGLPANRVNSIIEDREGHLWIGTSGGLVRYDGKSFTTFTTEDGLPRNSVRPFIQDRDGNLWLYNAGNGVIRYDGKSFAAFTTADGLLSNADGRFHNTISGMCQDRSGNIWFTRWGVSRYDGKTFTNFAPADGLPHPVVWGCVLDVEGNIWFTTHGGVCRYSDKKFTTFTTEDGLASNDVHPGYLDAQGHLWFGTDGGGISRYDGKVFQNLTAQDGLASNVYTSAIVQDRDGNFWFGKSGGVTRYRPPAPVPPPVFIDAVVADRRYQRTAELSLPSTIGLIVFELRAMSFKTRPNAMVYRYRLKGYDEGWKSTRERRVEYQDLPRGDYTFEVIAVDRDLVYSVAPATVALRVRLPYERIGWLSALSIAVVLVAWQTSRVIRRDRRLQASNTALSDANKELFQANIGLNRERAVERIRGEVQAMERASDFERVLSVLSEDLKTSGLSFDTCSIDVLDEPVDDPTMAHFESHGFRYQTYKLDPEGTVSRESYHIPAPFPDVNRGPIERFAVGEVWQGRDMDLGAMVEVPIGQYGRLRMTDADRGVFTEADCETLQEFASAISLGYSRYLDFQQLESQNEALSAANQQIQEQTQRKSAFLASMAHDLRTPMTAIMGFTKVVLRRGAERLSERHRGNLNKVIQASDHLLAMINDLMDLSRIEAGRMDVNPEVFDVKALVATCCATVSPLVSEKPDVKLEYDVSDDIGEANTDQARLRRMVINLLSNAIKFTDAGSVTVNATRVGDQLAIAVADTGRGIPADEIDTIFDEYRQVKGSDKEQKGTGLGLSITRKFAELLGGSIRVESEIGKGSTFTVRIPVVYGES